MGADTAVQLARAGYDVALTARDQQRLDAVADEVRAQGVRAVAVVSDLTDRASMSAFADASLREFGTCDLVCNIGVYQGAGGRQLVMDTELDELVVSFEADVVAPVLLCRRALPFMLQRGRGTIVNMSSSSVFLDPPGTVHENGWSFAYVGAKAGLDQLAGILNVELGAQGVRAFNVEPGFVAYGDALDDTIRRYPGVPVSPPDAIGPAIVWLARNPNADRLRSKRVDLPGLAHKHGLLPGWDGPGTSFRSTRNR